MAKKITTQHVDAELLDAIFILRKDWKQIQAIGLQSIDRTFESRYVEKMARARYLFLLREARHHNISALRM